MTLGDLLGMVNDPYLLKMDCEGCEYDAILNSKRLGELRQIQMEYHYGPERLVETLR
jgi:FkbM family methyltransferase